MLAILTGRTDFLSKYSDETQEWLIRNFRIGDPPEEREGEETPVDDRSSLFRRDSLGKLRLQRTSKVVVMLPRGLGKTSIAGIIVPIYNVVFREHPVTLYVSESGSHSKMQLSNVKSELESNGFLKAVFGDFQPDYKSSNKWSEDIFETTTGMTVIARGRGGQVRGLNHKGNRPSNIVVDDLEDKESTETELQRIKTRRWAYGDLFPCLPSITEGTITVLGTMLHEDCLLETLSKDPEWTVVRFGAHDCDGQLLWADYLERERKNPARIRERTSGEIVACGKVRRFSASGSSPSTICTNPASEK